MIVGDARAQPSHGVRARVETRAAHAVLPQSGSGLVQSAAPVCAGGRGAAPLGDAALAHGRAGCPRPGIRHADPQTVDLLQSEGTWSALMVLGRTGQDGP